MSKSIAFIGTRITNCRTLAEGDVGAALIGRLTALTGADVAALTDLTGAAAPGGNAALEMAKGSIEAPLACSGDALDNFNAVLVNAPPPLHHRNISTGNAP